VKTPRRLPLQVAKYLRKKRLTVAVAESCTGGLVSHLLTKTPGSSDFFLLGIVAYSTQSKISFLRIPKTTLEKKGVYSKEVAVYMAQKVRELAHADLGVGLTGIAGPSGTTAAHPAGEVFIALAKRRKAAHVAYHFKGNRVAIQQKAAAAALRLISQWS
jgi:PncC family amidohydrolase